MLFVIKSLENNEWSIYFQAINAEFYFYLWRDHWFKIRFLLQGLVRLQLAFNDCFICISSQFQLKAKSKVHNLTNFGVLFFNRFLWSRFFGKNNLNCFVRAILFSEHKNVERCGGLSVFSYIRSMRFTVHLTSQTVKIEYDKFYMGRRNANNPAKHITQRL